jgi:predicted ArsR family transcriptional regulator
MPPGRAQGPEIDPALLRARALADPTRRAVHRALQDSPRPWTIAELSAHVGVHHNAVRRHLALLRDAGLVLEQREIRDRPGRPRLLYDAAPVTSDERAAYEQLSLLLLQLVDRGGDPRATGRDAGRREAVRLHVAGEDAITALETHARVHGFAPRRVRGRGGAENLLLEQCPIATAAARDPATVCALHEGLAQGIVDGSTPGEVQLVARDPHRAGCRLRVRPAGDDLPGFSAR